uniref:Enoyl reductase (ER) domain-containing protein n=1 Tax=Helicotheca tamesis TaxID=374047 RepID=A0A7S2GWZ4_9STRA
MSSNHKKKESVASPSSNAESMKCALVTDFAKKFGEVEDIITFSTNFPRPVLDQKKKQMIVRVLCCSIAAGDSIVLGGKIIFLRPKLPFVPGMDVCGVVEAVTDKVKDFKVGDIVAANNGFMPVGGMAEYMLVDASLAVFKPPSVDIIQAAACSSAVTSLHSVKNVKKGDRVLVLGGSGGVGSSAIRLAKNAGASFIATTSTQHAMCSSLGADEVINYNEENWWERDTFRNNPFDIVIDTVGGGNFYGKAVHVLKSNKRGGHFIAVTGDDPKPDLTTWFKAIRFLIKIPGRPLWTRIRRAKYPRFTTLMPYDETNGLAQVLALIEKGDLEIILDESSPLPFTEEGVKTAFKTQGYGHAHGKVVVKMESVQ